MRALAMLCGATLLADAAAAQHWTTPQLAQLRNALAAAPADGLAALTGDAERLDRARAAGDQDATDALATDLAVHLLEAQRDGCCHAAQRHDWQVTSPFAGRQPVAEVTAAVAADRLPALLAEARPSHPWFVALSRAHATETDPARRARLAINMDRWRWLPRRLGRRYLLVNAAAFEATLWQDDAIVGRWRVITGKTKSPTPVFAATVTGVVFNPWWDIPDSIVRESVGRLVRTQPARAAAQGYVVQNGRYRQKPGPQNALGRMKLVMPNPHAVYLHDTPARPLFARDVRAFSHGCVRVGDALGLATALLATGPEWDGAATDAAVASGETMTVPLARPVPVYVTYFTAEPDGLGGVRFLKDIYRRDDAAGAVPEAGCPVAPLAATEH